MSFASIGSSNTWGFSPSFDCLQLLSPATAENPSEVISILLINPGDYRHVLETISKRLRDDNKRNILIEFYILEASVDSICRNILLLSTFLDTKLPIRQRANTFLEIFGNSKLQKRTKEYVCELSQLITSLLITRNSASEQSLLASLVDLSFLKYRDRDSMEATFNRYKGASNRDMSTLWEHRQRGYYTDRFDNRGSLADYDHHYSIKGTAADIIHLKQFREWRASGLAFEFNDQQYTEDNSTLLSYAEGAVKAGPQRGLKKEMLGYWGDIISSPYYSFGIDTETLVSGSGNEQHNQYAEGLFEIVNKDTGTEQRRHHTVEIALHTLLSWMWETEIGVPYSMTRPNDIFSGLGSGSTDTETDKSTSMLSSISGIKIIPVLPNQIGSSNNFDIASSAELSKTKYDHKFDCVFVSSRAVGVLKMMPDEGLSRLLKSSHSTVALETAKYIVNVTRQQKIDFAHSLNTLATTRHGLKSISAPVFQRRRDDKDSTDDVLFYRLNSEV